MSDALEEMARQLVARLDQAGGTGTLQVWYDTSTRWWNVHLLAGPIESRVTGESLGQVLAYARDVAG